jgi:hypothetical protein
MNDTILNELTVGITDSKEKTALPIDIRGAYYFSVGPTAEKGYGIP